jgi:hypothetical protein
MGRCLLPLALVACRFGFDPRSDAGHDDAFVDRCGFTSVGTALLPTLAPALRGATSVARSARGGCALLAGNVSCWGKLPLHANGDDSDTRPLPVVATCE